MSFIRLKTQSKKSKKTRDRSRYTIDIRLCSRAEIQSCFVRISCYKQAFLVEADVVVGIDDAFATLLAADRSC